MLHLLHHTNGFILQSRDFGESNRFYRVLTADHGLVSVTAQGVRELRSKLRYHLRDFTELRLTLVRGREVWRLTAVEMTEPTFVTQAAERVMIKRIFSLLCRLMPDEEVHQEIFSGLKQLAVTLRTENREPEALYRLELETVLSLLYQLGYVPAEVLPDRERPLNPNLAVAAINQALVNSML